MKNQSETCWHRFHAPVYTGREYSLHFAYMIGEDEAIEDSAIEPAAVEQWEAENLDPRNDW